MPPKRAAIQKVALVMVVITTMMVAAAATFSYFSYTNPGTQPVVVSSSAYISQSTSTTSTTSQETASTSQQCVITGQANGFDLRIVWDSNQTPIAGAFVNATSEPDSVNGQPCGEPKSQYFTTSGSQEWYSLGAYDIGRYSVLINYSGQSYTLAGGLAPLSTTCASLYLPSGRTNVTISSMSTACR